MKLAGAKCSDGAQSLAREASLQLDRGAFDLLGYQRVRSSHRLRRGFHPNLAQLQLNVLEEESWRVTFSSLLGEQGFCCFFVCVGSEVFNRKQERLAFPACIHPSVTSLEAC